MENIQERWWRGSTFSLSPMTLKEAFSRLDESDDQVFYETDRFVSHLDSMALDTVTRLIGGLIVEENPVLLDLMAGWDSHLPADIQASRVTGLGLNENELKANRALTDYVLHDLNRSPALPFDDAGFDAVINTVSVDYLTRPVEVFSEAGRILKPGGLFLVIFSNRMFTGKAVRVWREASETERLVLVEEYFRESGLFEEPRIFVSRGRPRPEDDKYADSGLPSDPIYAVYADRRGGNPSRRPRPAICAPYGPVENEAELAERRAKIKETHRCPFCGEKLKKWEVPDNPFVQTWDNDFMYICFNDACPYYVRGHDVMARGKCGSGSYRLMYNPENDCCQPIPALTPHALKEGIVE